MKIGLQLPHFRPSNPDTMRHWLIETAQAVDQGEFDSLWVMDHFFQLGGWLGEAEDVMVEGYTTLGFLAGVTQKVKIGLLVGGVIYRHPALVIKMVSTLDVLSGGRAYMGIGAAWYEHETVSLGMKFPPVKDRFEQLEEILQIAHHMWSGKTTAFSGNQFQLPYPVNNPQPLTKPHPPILIGGMGPRKTLRFVAKYADACNFFAGAGMEVIENRLEVLRNHCEDVGRPYDHIEKTILVTADLAGGSPGEVIELGQSLKELGFVHIIFNVKGEYNDETLSVFNEEIIPALK